MYKQIMNCLLILNDAGKSERGLKKLSPELGFMKESITNSKSAFKNNQSKITFSISLYERR